MRSNLWISLISHGNNFLSELVDCKMTKRRSNKGKQMTGGDTLKARPLYGTFVEFSIIGKLWLATNSLPQINNTDHGIWH